jgi:hypothetical protein
MLLFDPFVKVTFSVWVIITPEFVSRWRMVTGAAPLTDTVANRARTKLWPLTPRLSPTNPRARQVDSSQLYSCTYRGHPGYGSKRIPIGAYRSP